MKVPLARFATGEPITSITARIDDAVNGLGGKASVSFVTDFNPIWVEIEDPELEWIPKAPTEGIEEDETLLTIEVKLMPESIGGYPTMGSVRVIVDDRTEYPGYAMNADFEGEHADKNDRPDLLCDPERQDNCNGAGYWIRMSAANRIRLGAASVILSRSRQEAPSPARSGILSPLIVDSNVIS